MSEPQRIIASMTEGDGYAKGHAKAAWYDDEGFHEVGLIGGGIKGQKVLLREDGGYWRVEKRLSSLSGVQQAVGQICDPVPVAGAVEVLFLLPSGDMEKDFAYCEKELAQRAGKKVVIIGPESDRPFVYKVLGIAGKQTMLAQGE